MLQNGLQRCLARSTCQKLNLLLGEFGKCGVGGCKDGDARTLWEFKFGGLHQCKKRCQVCLGCHRCERARRGLLGGGGGADWSDPIDFKRKRTSLLIGESDTHRFNGCRVERGGVAHALAEAVQCALTKGDLNFDPLAGLGVKDTLVAARHESHARGSNVTLVRAPVAFYAHAQSRGAGECSFRDGGTNLRESAVVFQREFASEAQRATFASGDASG